MPGTHLVGRTEVNPVPADPDFKVDRTLLVIRPLPDFSHRRRFVVRD